MKEIAADGSVHECRLILSDMDNTILPKGEKTVSVRTHEAFRKALSAGIPIGPSSGRARSWVPPMFAGDEECCATAVATNGLEVYLEGSRAFWMCFQGILGAAFYASQTRCPIL